MSSGSKGEPFILRWIAAELAAAAVLVGLGVVLWQAGALGALLAGDAAGLANVTGPRDEAISDLLTVSGTLLGFSLAAMSLLIGLDRDDRAGPVHAMKVTGTYGYLVSLFASVAFWSGFALGAGFFMHAAGPLSGGAAVGSWAVWLFLGIGSFTAAGHVAVYLASLLKGHAEETTPPLGSGEIDDEEILAGSPPERRRSADDDRPDVATLSLPQPN